MGKNGQLWPNIATNGQKGPKKGGSTKSIRRSSRIDRVFHYLLDSLSEILFLNNYLHEILFFLLFYRSVYLPWRVSQQDFDIESRIKYVFRISLLYFFANDIFLPIKKSSFYEQLYSKEMCVQFIIIFLPNRIPFLLADKEYFRPSHQWNNLSS